MYAPAEGRRVLSSHEVERKSRELELAARQLREANARLRELDAQKDDFLSQVSHELRTPMTSVRAFSEILLEGGETESADAKRFIGIIHGESLRLTRLLDQILDLNVLERGETPLPVVPTDAAEVMAKAVETVRGLARAAGAEIELRAGEGGDAGGARVMADPDRLTQVLINLLSNALKYNDSDAPRVWAEMSVSGGVARLSVSDNGPGVAEADRERVFLKFSRGWDRKDRGGAGLGLAISREIMRRFGYYVTESSEHNAEYTPFWIKADHPELIGRYNIPLDEYPRRCETQIADWGRQKDEILAGKALEHTRSVEYAATIVGALVNDAPARIHGNVLNRGAISNLPSEAIVEVPVLVDGNGLNPAGYGTTLPTQCAALNMTNINVQLLTIEAAATRSRDRVYQAALLDPHTAGELSPDEIVAMCDELFDAHREWLPAYR